MKRVFGMIWIGDKSLQDLFPRQFALELDKEVLVADKMKSVVGHSFRRPVRAGSEHQQMVDLNSLLESVSLSQSHDRWFCDLTGDGEFRVKEMRVSPDHYSPDMSMVGVGLTGSYVLFGLAELVFFYSSFV
uniref:RNA-directed DNA polymerase, eukaryota n=1 Tax=Tanacetum cinerariifolium TaxID=118510 RepID=A0A6L2MIJ5_TANCI|nr:RNA-directed DNA polymerase, eukaryota [Tanacetum cinerariifolium]